MKEKISIAYNNIKHKKQFLNIILSYVIIIIAVMVVSFIGHIIISKIAQKETFEANSRLVRQMKTICDEYIENALLSANRMINTESVNSIASKTEFSSEEMSKLVKNVMAETSVAINSNKIISNLYIVFNKRDICITNQTVFNKQILYETAFSDFFPSRQAMLDTIFQSNMKEFKVLQNEDKQKLILLYSFNSKTGYYNKGTMPTVIILELSLNNVIKTQNENFVGNFILVCDGGEVLLSENDNIDYAQYIKNKDSEFRYDGKTYIINSVKSKIFGASYVHIIEKSVYAKRMTTINFIIAVCFILCLIIGIIMAVLLAEKNYISVSKLLDKIEMDTKRVEMKESYMREMYLANIVTGKAEVEEEILKKYLLNFKEKYYAVILFNIVEFGIDNDENHKTVLFSISNVFSELTADMSTNYYCKSDGFYVCVVNFPTSLIDKNEFCQKLEHTNEFLNMHLGISFVYVMSDITDNTANLHRLYEQSVNTLSSKFTFNDEDNMDSNDIDDRCVKIMQYIEENYSDGNLSVKEIADYFGLSFNYISKYFKEHTGEGLAKYIICKRIEKAKEMLLTTSDSISKIADKTGFYSANVFIRTFKKIVEMTPGQFRNVNCK